MARSGAHSYVAAFSRPITPRILSRELKELEQRGLISREEYPIVPRKVEYSLTERGRTLVPILTEIVRWGSTGIHESILASSPDRAPENGRGAASA